MNDIQMCADYICMKLKEHGVVIQRYDAKSTMSIYLKFDYGLCNSVRISDHRGKDHLTYKYNLRTDVQDYYMTTTEGIKHHFFHIDQADKFVRMVLIDRFSKMGKWGMAGYMSLAQRTVSRQAQSKNKFWQSATFVGCER